MLSSIKRFFNKPEVRVFDPSVSCHFDGEVIIISKQKVWPQGPLHIRAEPVGRFSVTDLGSIQKFLVECLTSPTEIDESPKPDASPKSFNQHLKVKSLVEGVRKYRSVSMRVNGDVLKFTPSTRDIKQKAWMHLPEQEAGVNWREEHNAAKVLLAAFELSK